MIFPQLSRGQRGVQWVFFLFYMGVGVFHPYIYLYLRDVGLTESTIGYISFFYPLFVLIIQPCWGSLGDYTGRPDRVIRLAAFGAGLCSIVFLWNVPTWGYWLLVPIFFGFASAVDPIANAGAVQSDRDAGDHGNYGSRRLWGSIGFVLGAIASGLISDWYGIPAVFPVFALVMIFTIIQARHLRHIRIRSAGLKQVFRGVNHALSLPRYRGLLLVLVLWGIPFSGNFVAFGWYWRDLGGADYGIGLCWVLAAVLEVPFYMLTVRFKDWISYRGLLIFSNAIASLRWLLYILFPWPIAIYFFQPLHALMFVSFSVGGVYLIDEWSDHVIKNTGQGLLSASVFGAGAALGNVLAGQMYGWLGPVTFYSFMILINIIAGSLGWMFLFRRDR